MNGQGAGDGEQPPADGNAAGGVGDGSQS
jgi:hypothetical protein